MLWAQPALGNHLTAAISVYSNFISNFDTCVCEVLPYEVSTLLFNQAAPTLWEFEAECLSCLCVVVVV